MGWRCPPLLPLATFGTKTVLFMIFIIKMKTLVGPCGGDGMEGEGCRRNSQAISITITITTSRQTITITDDDIKQ